MNCVSCRREIADGSNFCPYCGGTQAASAPTPPPIPGTAPPPIPGSQPSAPLGGVRSTPGGGIPSGTYSQGGVPSGADVPGPSQRATLSFILGIASIVVGVLCCMCYGLSGLPGFGLGLTAFILGRNELEDIAAGFSSPAGHSNASTGKTLGLIGMIVGALIFVIGIAFIIFAVALETANQSTYPY